MSKSQDLIYSAYNNPIVAKKYYDEFYVQDLPIISGCFDRFLSSIKTGNELLDLGCGAGQHCEYSAKKGFKVLGIDFSMSMLKIAERLKSTNNISYKYGNLLELNKVINPNKKFDGIIMCFSLLCFNNEEVIVILNNVKKYLKIGGKVFIVTALENEQEVGREIIEEEPFDTTEKQYYKYYTKHELTKLLLKHGFRNIIVDKIITPNPNDAADAALVAIAEI